MGVIQKIFLTFTIIGGIAWGLIGLFDFNLVTFITQGENIFSRIIYVLVGISAIINILIYFYRIGPMEKKENEIN